MTPREAQRIAKIDKTFCRMIWAALKQAKKAKYDAERRREKPAPVVVSEDVQWRRTG